MKHCPEEERKTDDEEYLKKLRTMKPSKFVEEVFGIKLLPYQKIIVDNAAKPGKWKNGSHWQADIKGDEDDRRLVELCKQKLNESKN